MMTHLGAFLLYILIPAALSQSIQCLGKQSCKNTKLTCNSKACTLICDGGIDGQSCLHAELDASQATNVTVSCKNVRDCSHMSIVCGIGPCNIECAHALSCQHVHLLCGSGDCTIQCPLQTSCDKLSVDTTSTSRFLCIGSTDHCPSNFPSFTPATSTTVTPITTGINPQSTSPPITSSTLSTTAALDPTMSTISDLNDDFIMASAKESVPWIRLLQVMLVFAIICVVILFCGYKVYTSCSDAKSKTNDTPKDNKVDDWIIEMTQGNGNKNHIITDGDATPGVTTMLKPSTCTNETKYSEGEQGETPPCMETSELIGNEMSDMGLSRTAPVDGDRSKMVPLSRHGTLDKILQDDDDYDDRGTGIGGNVTPLFGASIWTPTGTMRSTLRGNTVRDLVGEYEYDHDDKSIVVPSHPNLCLNHSATIVLPGHVTDMQLNHSTSLPKTRTRDGRLRLVLYDFDQTITTVHLYKELNGKGCDALKCLTNERLIEIFGGWPRVERLKKHFEMLNTSEIQIGILSFGFEGVIRNVLERIDLLHYFEFVIGRDSELLRKEKGNKAQYIANYLVRDAKFKNTEILFVDDDAQNIERAIKKECCQTLLVQPPKGMNETHLQQIECLM